MGFFDSSVEFKLPKDLRKVQASLAQKATGASPVFPERQVAMRTHCKHWRGS